MDVGEQLRQQNREIEKLKRRRRLDRTEEITTEDAGASLRTDSDDSDQDSDDADWTTPEQLMAQLRSGTRKRGNTHE